MLLDRRCLILAFGASLAASSALAQQQPQGQRAAQTRQQQQEQQRREPPKQFPVGASWTLMDIGGRRAPTEATLRIDSQFRGAGFAGCNTFSAAMYPARGQTIVAGPLAITKRACAPAVMQFERTFLTGLYSQPQWDLVGDVLTLKTRVGVMRFRRGF